MMSDEAVVQRVREIYRETVVNSDRLSMKNPEFNVFLNNGKTFIDWSAHDPSRTPSDLIHQPIVRFRLMREVVLAPGGDWGRVYRIVATVSDRQNMAPICLHTHVERLDRR